MQCCIMPIAAQRPKATPDRNNSRHCFNFLTKRDGALMRQIIYGVLLITIWICVIVIAVLNSDDPEMLIACGLVAAISTAALADEFVEWRSRPRTRKVSLEQRSI